MSSWTKEDLYKLDLKYANEGVHPHQRPFRAARELLGADFVLGVGGNPEVDRIIEAYALLVPEGRETWPGAGIGLAVSVDRALKLTLPVVFGRPLIVPWKASGYATEAEWWQWCRQQRDIAAAAHFAFADLFDFAYGLNEIEHGNAEAATLWHMAQSNLADVAHTLPVTFSVDSVLQPICMVAELAMKGTLLWQGADPKTLKGADGHVHSILAGRMAAAKAHRDDPVVALIASRLPPYVESRYKPAGLTRIEVLRLALGVQFIAASALRRLSSVDLAMQMEAPGEFPGPRQAFFPGSATP